MAISKDKKRYHITLTPANVDRFQNVCKRLGLPASTMSNAFDSVLTGLSESFEMAIDKGEMKISDVMFLMGKQIEKMEGGEKPHEVKQKRNPVTRKTK